MVAYTGPAKAARFTHAGLRNIAVHSYGTRSDLLVNDIGPYTGAVVWTAGFYTVKAGGELLGEAQLGGDFQAGRAVRKHPRVWTAAAAA